MSIHMRHKVINVLSITGYILLATFALWFHIYTHTKVAAQPVVSFDHSNCQYPDRTTNPVNGCDNTDPCDPANTKGGSGDCTPAYVEHNTGDIPVAQPFIPPVGGYTK